MPKNDKLTIDIVKKIKTNLPNIVAVTGKMGIEYDGQNNYYALAHKAAQTGKIQKESQIAWAPFSIDPQTMIVCGLKESNLIKEDAGFIEALIVESRYEDFLVHQIERFLDPKSKFIKELLETNQYKDFEQAIDKGDVIGVNLRSPQAVILIEVPGYFKLIHNRNRHKNNAAISEEVNKCTAAVMDEISDGFHHYDQNITGCFGPDRFVILKWASGDVNTLNTIDYYKKKAEYVRKLVARQTGLVTTTAVGQYHPGLTGLRKSYRDAECALDLGKRIWGAGKSYHIVDIGMYISLSESVSFERKAELAHQILGNIIRDQDLYKTMRTYFEMNLNLTEAAKRLHLHRNTLIYRLEKVKRELGLDPRKFSDALQIKLGLMLYSPNLKRCEQKETGKPNARL